MIAAKNRVADRFACTHVQNILLLINEEAHIKELMRVADALLQTADLRPVIFIEDRLKHLGKPSIFAERGIEVLTSDGFAGGELRHSLGSVRWTVRRLLAALIAKIIPIMVRLLPEGARAMLGSLGTMDWEYVAVNRNVMLRRAAVCEAVLSQRDYLAVVMSEDNVELDTGIWIAVARQHGIRSVIVPYTISNTAEFAESYVNHQPYQVLASPQNRAVARLFPAWMLNYKGKQFLRSVYAKIVAVEQLGLTPPNPWLLNSGYADAIAVESAAMYDYYRAAGIPAEQLAVTGSLTDDVIASALADVSQCRRTLLRQFCLTDDRPLLVCALPPDQNTYDRPGCEFTDFNDLIGYWGACLAAVQGWNIVVRPHPKTSPKCLDVLRRHSPNVSYQDTATLVPLCDLYVASVSATIRWAIACGKAVINYDVYQYGYQDYSGVGGVILVNTRTQFRDTLTQLTRDTKRRAEVAAIQHHDSARWGNLDRASGQRLIALLRSSNEQSSLHPSFQR